jgi:hypothetical protein
LVYCTKKNLATLAGSTSCTVVTRLGMAWRSGYADCPQEKNPRFKSCRGGDINLIKAMHSLLTNNLSSKLSSRTALDKDNAYLVFLNIFYGSCQNVCRLCLPRAPRMYVRTVNTFQCLPCGKREA